MQINTTLPSISLTTVNNQKAVHVNLDFVTHVIDDPVGCWVHLTSGKAVHVKETLEEVLTLTTSAYEGSDSAAF
jgi:hypothetical protein